MLPRCEIEINLDKWIEAAPIRSFKILLGFKNNLVNPGFKDGFWG